MNDLIGHALGRYHILEKLGEGGMAVVYKAYDTHLEHEVAVKVIRIDNLPRNAEERALKRFEREAKAVAKLDHPNIVKVTDYGEYEGSPYLVMPYQPGGTLKQFIKEHGHVDWREAARMLVPVAEALVYAHEQGLIHRDVKPSNILLSAKGWPMLTDFGVAKVVDDEMTQDLTGTSATVGTPEYMAPEQVMSKTVDHRADIYALGVVFYEMVTGRRPYEADTPMAVLVMHSRDPLPRPKELVPDLPDEVERVLLKALAKRPEDRHFDMAAFAGALAGLQHGEPGKPSVKVGATPRSVTVAPDQYKTVDQFTEESGPERIRTDRDIPAKLNMQAQPEAPAQRAGTKTLFIVGGIALAALLVIGITSGWFKPRPAAPATVVPVIAEIESPTLTATPPTATQKPPTATSVPPTPTEAYTIGSTMVSPKDGMTMVYVPAGEFLMGSPEGVGHENEHPQHTVYLDAYWIDQTEVTNAMYEKCVASGECTAPGSSSSYTRDSYYGNSQYDNFPVIYVDWYQAEAYCTWAGRELPTEAQWEKAARGTDARTYPWGNETASCNVVNFNGCNGKATEVGKYPQGASPYKALDMAGNVWEWVEDWFLEYSSERIINPAGPPVGEEKITRGGSFSYYDDIIYSSYRHVKDFSDADTRTGFRCSLPIFDQNANETINDTNFSETISPETEESLESLNFEGTLIGNAKCRKGPDQYLYGYDSILGPQKIFIKGRNVDSTWINFSTLDGINNCWTVGQYIETSTDIKELPFVKSPAVQGQIYHGFAYSLCNTDWRREGYKFPYICDTEPTCYMMLTNNISGIPSRYELEVFLRSQAISIWNEIFIYNSSGHHETHHIEMFSFQYSKEGMNQELFTPIAIKCSQMEIENGTYILRDYLSDW